MIDTSPPKILTSPPELDRFVGSDEMRRYSNEIKWKAWFS